MNVGRLVGRLMTVRSVFLTVAGIAALWAPATAGAQAGAEKFTQVCGPCHTIGGGRRVGPDLQGVGDRRSEQWLLSFIASPQKMISAGDPDATKLQQEYGMVMPDPAVTADEIKDLLAYIKTGGGQAAAAAAAEPAVPARAATPEDIQRGLELFQGTIRLANGGPACNSCHHVRNDAVIGGGVLARELTSVFSRMGAPGINAILGKAPFPVMDEAYRNTPLTEDETFALVSFFQDADARQELQQPSDYGFKLLYSGTGCFVVMMGVFAIFGRRRKKLPVNHKIFERQVKSQ